jgi:hypothetical protein
MAHRIFSILSPDLPASIKFALGTKEMESPYRCDRGAGVAHRAENVLSRKISGQRLRRERQADEIRTDHFFYFKAVDKMDLSGLNCKGEII